MLFVCFLFLCFFHIHLLFEHYFMASLQEMQSAIGRTTHERDRVLADMERIEQVHYAHFTTKGQHCCFDTPPER